MGGKQGTSSSIKGGTAWRGGHNSRPQTPPDGSPYCHLASASTLYPAAPSLPPSLVCQHPASACPLNSTSIVNETLIVTEAKQHCGTPLNSALFFPPLQESPPPHYHPHHHHYYNIRTTTTTCLSLCLCRGTHDGKKNTCPEMLRVVPKAPITVRNVRLRYAREEGESGQVGGYVSVGGLVGFAG